MVDASKEFMQVIKDSFSQRNGSSNDRLTLLEKNMENMKSDMKTLKESSDEKHLFISNRFDMLFDLLNKQTQ
jgi:hypothetical protein